MYVGCRFVAYLAAVQDYCTAFSGYHLVDMVQCDQVPFCRAMVRDADGHPFVEGQYGGVAWRASSWYSMVTDRRPKYECRPDWFVVLSQPCAGSAAAQMQHCMRDRPASEQACPPECNSLHIAFQKGYCNAASCWPPWMLKQLCNSTVHEFLNSTRLGWCTNKWCPSSCRGQTAADCAGYSTCVHEACAVAAQFVRNFSWAGFKGECKHTAAVDQLLASAGSMFKGQGCSVLNWVDNDTIDLGVLLGKVCQGTYPRPASLMPLLLDGGAAAVAKVWLDVAARQPASTREILVSGARRSQLSFASTQQAALIQCAAGYATMDLALSKPWLSHQLLEAVLPPGSAWRVKLKQGVPTCGGTTSSSDVCLDLSSVLGVEWLNGHVEDAQVIPWFVSNTSLSVVQNYCRRAFAPAPTDSAALVVRVNASCDKVSRDTDAIRRQQATRRMALALIWYGYVIFLLIGFLVLQLYWRLPERRKSNRGAGSGRCAWLSHTAGRLWHLLCPRVLEYHPGTPQAPRASGSQSWWVLLAKKAVNGVQALAYCVDVGLDIWTLVELRKNVESFAADASAYPSAGDYSKQLSWRSGHSNMLFWWLVIVFIVQYAAGILLTLPPTLAAYGIFDYQRLQFSWGCCTLVFFTNAFWIFIGLFFFVGAWYIMVADCYMLLAVVGVPARLLQGNRLNLPAYTTVRYLCEGIVEALPSALISTAALNQQLLSQNTDYMQLGVFWMSLIFSMLRIARELYKLACLTHDLDACCFSTAILDMIYHVQPQQGAGPAAAHANVSAQGQSGGPDQEGPSSSHSTKAPVSFYGPVVSPPQPDTGMTRDSTRVTSEVGLISAGSLGAPQGIFVLQDFEGSGFEAAAAADGLAAGAGGAEGAVPGSSTSKQRRSCCWRCQSCTEYPTVLAVYVYCCLACIMVYLLLVCSDVAYPWLLAANPHPEFGCQYDSYGKVVFCGDRWHHTLPPFSEQYNLLMMITSVPGLSKGSNATAECVLPSLTCD